MGRKECDGFVRTLKGRTLCFTGAVLVDGVRTVRRDCVTLAEARGAATRADYSGAVSVVVHGDLASKAVTDTDRGYSRTLVRVAAERDRGFHVCVVDAAGFSNLIRRKSARCLELRRADGGRRVLVLPHSGDGILGGPLRPRRTGSRQEAVRMVDLDLLDRGTAAHEATIAALIAHLAGRGIKACTHDRNAPRFDIGWAHDDEVFIGEVKSLSGTGEDQQIRLGIGQILDYAHQAQAAGTASCVTPVLVLEKQPASSRWIPLAAAHGILLTWAPEFVGC
ncbi:hypothetical protein [Yinghuangia soli]|uniref:Uncharacterized protein n=1 Tax=Yinghuangia soli TaxID=2908204 RepID=A0AA41PX17_9ACTN|nr:hypothetical protein [Yinghuangia soli]MCF2526107.1 hypothetical protein [Yinghuangia soli]